MLRLRYIIIPVILSMLLTVFSCRKKKSDVPPPPPKSSVKTINSFVIAAADNSTVTSVDIIGQMNGDTITVIFEEGLNLTSVIPTIEFTGVSLSPQNRTPQNFINPLSYTVTAEDGSIKKYFVKINLIRGNSVVYVGSDDYNLYALNAGTGTLRWKFTAGGNIRSSPVFVNNTVYFGSFDKYLYAVNASTGILKWRYKTDYPISYESPVIGGNAVFISNTRGDYPSGNVYAIDTATGLLIWKSVNNMEIPSGPLYAEGKVFICSYGGCRALDAATGTIVWNGIGGISKGNPLYYNGKIYFCGEGRFYCVNASDGSIVWVKGGMFPSNSSPTIDNNVLYCTSNGAMIAIDPGTGVEKWSRQSNGILVGGGTGLFSSPVVVGSVIYADNNDSYFYALSTLNGGNIWTKGNSLIDVGVMGSPTVANGVVFIGRYDSHIYAYDAITGNQKWKFQANGALPSGPCVVDTRGEVYCAGISGAKN